MTKAILIEQNFRVKIIVGNSCTTFYAKPVETFDEAVEIIDDMEKSDIIYGLEEKGADGNWYDWHDSESNDTILEYMNR